MLVVYSIISDIWQKSRKSYNHVTNTAYSGREGGFNPPGAFRHVFVGNILSFSPFVAH